MGRRAVVSQFSRGDSKNDRGQSRKEEGRRQYFAMSVCLGHLESGSILFEAISESHCPFTWHRPATRDIVKPLAYDFGRISGTFKMTFKEAASRPKWLCPMDTQVLLNSKAVPVFFQRPPI